MKKIRFFSLLLTCITGSFSLISVGQKLEYNGLTTENKILRYEEKFGKESPFRKAGADVSKDNISLKYEYFIIDCGLKMDENYKIEDYEVEMEIESDDSDVDKICGIYYEGREDNGGNMSLYNKELLSKYWNKSGIQKFTLRKIGKNRYYYFNGINYEDKSYYMQRGLKMGFMNYSKTKCKVISFKVSAITPFQSKIVAIPNIGISYQERRGDEVLKTVKIPAILQSDSTKTIGFRLLNYGPYDISGLKYEFKLLEGPHGLNLKPSDKYPQNSFFGQGDSYLKFIGIDISATKNVKSGKAKLGLFLTDLGTKFTYQPYILEFDVEGHPETDLTFEGIKIENILQNTSGLVYGSENLIKINLKNTKNVDAFDISLMNVSSNFEIISYDSTLSIKANAEGVLLATIRTPINLRENSLNLKFNLEARGMEAKEISVSVPYISLSSKYFDIKDSLILKHYFGLNSNFNHKLIYDSLSSDNQTNLRKYWWVLFEYLGDAGFVKNTNVGDKLDKNFTKNLYNEFYTGNLEAAILLGNYFFYGIFFQKNKKTAEDFFKYASIGGSKLGEYYLGAIMNDGNPLRTDKLTLAQRIGIKKADYELGLFELNKQKKEGFARIIALAEKNDPRSMYLAGTMYAKGEGVPQDIEKGVQLLKNAAESNITSAMIVLGTMYGSGNTGVYKDIKSSHEWFQKATKQDDLEGYFQYAIFQLDNELLGRNSIKAMGLLRYAASKGHLGSMKFLSKMLTSDASLDEKLLARYYINELQKLGENINNHYFEYIDYGMQIMQGINWQTALFGKEVDGINSYGQKVRVHVDSDIVEQLYSGFLDAYRNSRVPDPNSLNSLAVVSEDGRNDIYAATINGQCKKIVNVKKGDIIRVEAKGNIRLGMFAGVARPDGIGTYKEFNAVDGLNHGCLIATLDGEKWISIGEKKTLVAEKDGQFWLVVNDKDPSNNQGVFDIKISVKRALKQD